MTNPESDREKKPTVVAIVGPTASGKTALSLDIASAMGGEIIACDSRTVYRYMDIGTAKPGRAELSRIPHHLIDVVDPDHTFTAAEFRDRGRSAIADIVGRGRLPMVVGGTGFYARALLEDLAIPEVEPQPELRAELRALSECEGARALHERLRQVDPDAAARIAVNDVFRVIRALEVSIVSGQPFSSLAVRAESPYDTVWIGLTVDDRPYLHELIATRFKQQIQDGLVDEVERLISRFGRCRSLMNTVNYKEIVPLVEGDIDMAAAADECIKHNRQLARRQLIWFRANPDIEWFAVDKLTTERLRSAVSSMIERRLREKDVV